MLTPKTDIYAPTPAEIIKIKQRILKYNPELFEDTNLCIQFNGSISSSGYGTIYMFRRNGGPIISKAHRASYMVFVGQIPPKTMVLHHCDNPPCINPKHLFLGDQKDNMLDMTKKGRRRTTRNPGEKNPMAKLTKEKVQKMREERTKTGKPYYVIAKENGISTTTARRAITHESWKNT